MIKMIKLDRVCSVGEATAVEALGANIIGVSLSQDSRFADDRIVSIDLARSIQRSLTKAQFVAQMDFRNDPANASHGSSTPTSYS